VRQLKNSSRWLPGHHLASACTASAVCLSWVWTQTHTPASVDTLLACFKARPPNVQYFRTGPAAGLRPLAATCDHQANRPIGGQPHNTASSGNLVEQHRAPSKYWLSVRMPPPSAPTMPFLGFYNTLVFTSHHAYTRVTHANLQQRECGDSLVTMTMQKAMQTLLHRQLLSDNS
jgi:hypothetical protein